MSPKTVQLRPSSIRSKMILLAVASAGFAIVLTSAVFAGHQLRTLSDFVGDMSEFEQERAELVRITVLTALGSLAASLVFSIIFQQFISRPIQRVAETAMTISTSENYSLRVGHRGNDELGRMSRALDALMDRVQESQEALQVAREVAETGSRAKSEFLANMSHEIRTPMNAVLGFTDLMLRDTNLDAEERHDYLMTIRNSGQLLLRLINDILDLSKIEAGRLDLARTWCEIDPLIEEVIKVLRVRAQEKGLVLTYRWLTDIPEKVQTDPARLQQLMMNLVGNAIKFTHLGGVEVVAQLDTGEDPLVIIEVRDTGIGIPEEKLEEIFDPFVQVDVSTTRRYGGTGLGLPISRRIARALGGDVTASSTMAKGTTFTMSFDPGLLDHVTRLAPTSKMLTPAKTPHDLPENLILGPASILLVEDGDTNRRFTKLVLSRSGAVVAEAENGLVGVDLATQRHFDLILMDMQMPVMDGYTAAAQISELAPDVPIIALTAHAMAGDEEKCLAAGCSGYLSKPVEADLLLRTVAELIGTREAGDGRRPDVPRLSPSSHLPLDDPEFREIVDEFTQRALEKAHEITSAWQNDDRESMLRLAHWFKGAGPTVGFGEFSSPARHLEALIGRGSDDLGQPVREIRELVRLARESLVKQTQQTGAE